MKSLAKLQRVLGEIEITEEQQEALNEFFDEFATTIEERISEDYQNEISIKEDEIEELKNSASSNNDFDTHDEMISIEEAERAFDLFRRDVEKAFDLFESDTEKVYEKAFNKLKINSEKAFELFAEDSEKAFELFAEDAEKAFDLFTEDAEAAGELMSEDLKNIYAEKSMKAIEELYGSLEKEVKEVFKESEEYRALMDIKKIATPFVLEESEDELAKKIVTLNEEKETLFEEVESLKKRDIIANLVSDFPAKEAIIIQEFIEKGQSEDEIYERFSTVIELLESTKNESFKNNDIIEESEELDDVYKTYVKPKQTSWKKPSKSKINFQAFVNESKSSNKKQKKENSRGKNRNISFNESRKPKRNFRSSTRKMTPIFESKSIDSRKIEKNSFDLKPHEEKIINQVFGN